jgi:hypothetical protein
MVDFDLGEHNAKLMAEGTDGMDGVAALGFMTKTATLRLAVNGDTLRSTGTTFGGEIGVETCGEGGFEGRDVEATEEALEGRDMWCGSRGKAEGAFDGGGLCGTPLGNSEE